jgi:predicted metal-binding transcription factor (methanogenesis marker protein 9)
MEALMTTKDIEFRDTMGYALERSNLSVEEAMKMGGLYAEALIEAESKGFEKMMGIFHEALKESDDEASVACLKRVIGILQEAQRLSYGNAKSTESLAS